MLPGVPTQTAKRHSGHSGRPQQSRPSGFSATSSAVPFPIVLHRRARSAVRAHFARASGRIITLVVSDLGMLLLLRRLVHGIGDAAWLGESVAAAIRTLVPRGTFPTVQLIVAVLLGQLILGTYAAGDRRRDKSAIFIGTALGFALLFWGYMWERPGIASLLGFTLAATCVSLGLIVERALIDLMVSRTRRNSRHVPRAIVIGDERSARRALRSRALADPAEFRIIGFVDTSAKPASDALGELSEIVRIIEAERIDTIVLGGYIDDGLMLSLLDLADAAGCQLYSVSRLETASTVQPQVIWRRGEPLVQLTRPGLRGQQLVLKRLFDLCIAITALLLLAPLMIGIAIVIRASSRGPIIFRQCRVGVGGRPFFIYKFRSMVRDAESRRTELAERSIYADERLFKMTDDPRITAIGRWLRRTSLDELPQLFNVVLGSMSIVGPRPPLPSEVAHYEERHYTRFESKPGITGPWQVGGRSRITDFEEIVRLESAYIRRWSIWKDLDIFLRTIPVVLKMDGAH